MGKIVITITGDVDNDSKTLLFNHLVQQIRDWNPIYKHKPSITIIDSGESYHIPARYTENQTQE